MLKRILKKLGYVKKDELRSLFDANEIAHVDAFFQRVPLLISNSKNAEFGLKGEELQEAINGSEALSKLFYESF